MAEITVDVGVRLKAMQSSVADLQKVLDGLQPNSSGFKALQRIIADINRDMDRLRIQTSKPFGSQNQFNQTEKTVDKLEESLEKVKITIDRIKFSDLKLDSSQTAQLDNFKQQLKDIKQEFTDFKADLKGQFLDNDFNKAFVEGINPNLLNKNFDEIIKNVNSKVDSLGSALARAKADLEEFQNASKLGEKINKIPDEGLISQAGLGENFKKFFQINSKGIFGFKTGGGLQKGEIKQQFIKYLTEEFQLTEGQIKQLQDQTTAKAIRDLLSNKDFFNTQLNAATTANKKMSGAESTFTTASKNYENAAAVVARLTPLLSALSNEELSLEDKQKLVNQAIRQFEQECINGAKGSKTLKDSTKGLSSNLESFKNQLGEVNVQWLNLQKQQATFNSMKSAIVNFMGFNQVLNLTKKAVKEAMDHIKQLDTTMNGIAIVTDMTTADLWNQVDVYSEMAQRYGTSIQGAYEVSKIYYQAGYETNDVLTLMNETLKMSKISGLDYATTTDYMMNAIKGFKMEVADAASVVDVYSALAANTAVSQQELAEAMSKTASSMAGVGSTFEDTSAMIATMVSVTRESANNIGSAMKSIASRYGELTKDPTKLLDSEGEAMSFNKVDTALKSVGITLQTTDHQFRDFTDVIVELANKWDTLDSAQQRYIATQFAGNRQQNRFLALVSNKDLLQENMDVAAASEDTGTLQALKALDSLESKLNQVQVAYQQFYTTIGIENVWKAFLDGTENVINTLNNLPKLFGKIPVGAIAVIYDIISLIKTTALNGLSEIASIWIQKTQEMTAQTQSESGKNRDNGTAWVDNFVSGIRSRISEIRNAAREAVDAANQEARDQALEQAKQNNPQPNPDFNVSHLNDLVKQYDKTSGAEQLQASTAIMNEYGMTINSARSALEAYARISQQATQATEEAGKTALSGGQKFLVEAQGIAKAALSSKKLASTTSGLAMGLNTIAMLINTTSESGKHLAGTLMTVAGGLRAVGAVLQYVGSAGQMAFPWMAVITGIIGIVNGISTAYETAQEKLERLQKEAEDSKNAYIIKKDNLKSFDNAIKKYEELEKKQYDGVEAREAFLKSSNDIAEQFPELISGYDSEGNAIVDLTNKYELLALKKAEAAEAGLKNAGANVAVAEQTITNLGSDIKDAVNKIQNVEDIELGKAAESVYNSANTSDFFGQFKDFSFSQFQTMYNYLGANIASQDEFMGEIFNIFTTINNLEESMVNELKESFPESSDFINQIRNSSDFDSYISSQDLTAGNQALKDFWNDEIYGPYQTVLTELANQKDLSNIFKTGRQALIEYNNVLEKLEQSKNDKTESEIKAIQATIDNFKQTYDSTNQQIQDIIDNYGEYNIALNTLDTANKDFIARNVYSEYVNSLMNADDIQNNIWQYYEKSSQGVALLNKRLWDSYQAGLENNQWKDVNQFLASQEQDGYKGIIDSFNESFGTFWNSASDSTREAFNTYYNNLGNYTREQAEQMATNMGLDFEATGLAESWEDSDVTQRVRDALKARESKENLAMLEEAGKLDFIPSVLEEQFKSVADIVNGYSREGLFANAHDLGVNYVRLVEAIQENARENNSEIVSLLSDADLSFSGISKLKEILSKEYQINDGPIIEALDGVSNTLVENITAQIASLQEGINSNLKDVTSNLEKMGSGLEYSDALSIFEKIRSKNENINFTDLFNFDLDLGKYVATSADAIQKYLDAEEAVLRANEEHITAVLAAANSFIVPHLTTETWQKQIDQEEYRETAVELGLQTYIDEIEAAQKSIDEKNTPENQQRLLKAVENYNKAWNLAIDKNTADLTAASEALGNVTSASQLKSLLNTQEYDKYLKTIGVNTNTKDFIAAGDKSIVGSKAFFNQINSVYDSLISDILSKGFENIHLEDYKDLIKGDDAAIKEAIQSGNYSYEQFIRDYGYLTSKSIEEINSLITQAIEKDAQATTGAAAEAVGKIQWLSSEGKGFAALKDIQTLADALGISADKILGEYNNQLDMYLVDLSNVEGIDLSAIDGFSDTVKDSINAFLKQIFENVNKAITGKLTNADVTTLTGQLEQLGLKDITLDFTRTVDGLKLSQRNAMELYNELKKIDALQAQLVFDELAKSLETNDTNYINISTTLARIAELEKAIKEMKPDDARLQMYKNELAVAQEIARTRSSTDNKDFNFMDRALPTGMQNPIDYWNATGEAYKVMNASAKSGYMEIQDFYNIVQEMSNMAQVSGQTLHFMGQEIDGSAETAAALIQRGFSALTNVKGDGVKIALNNIGADFKTGAADMKGDFDSGVREMAKSQIQMLDAAINMLEAIVAMENIGDIDTNGNGIDYGELFDDIWDPNNEEWITKWDKNAQTTIDEIVKAGEKNSELKKAFESFYLEGYSLWELLKDDGEKLTKIGKEGRDKLVEAFNIINELANSDDWEIGNLDQIYKKIEASGLQDLFSQHIYNEEAGFSLIITPDIQTEIDWNSPEVEKRLKETGFKTDEEARKFLDAFVKGEKTEPIDYVTVKILSGDIEITDKNTYKYHGQEFTDKAKLAEIINKERNFDAELNNIDTESNTITFSKTIGLQKVTIVQEEDGTTTYKFEDGTIIKAPDEETALKLYAENYRQTHSSLANLSDEEILMQRHLLVEEQVEIKINEKVDKQIRNNAETFRNHTIQEINEAIEKSTSTANGEGIIIKLGEETFTLSGTKEELSGKGQEIADLAAQELGIDTALSTTISDGISQAFSGESGTKISKAITDGITDAFTNVGKNGEDNALSVPAITLKPESVTIQLGENEPTVQGLEGEGIKITSVDISANSAYVSSAKYQAGTAESPLTTVTLEAIDSATGTANTLYVNCPNGTVVGDTVTIVGFTADGTATTFTVNNTTGQLSTDTILNVPIRNAEGYITGFFHIDPSGATYAGMKKGSKIENLKGINAEGEAVTVTVECGESTDVAINDPNVTIPDEIKATAEKGKVTLTKYTISTVDGSGNIKTLVAYGEADLTAKISEYGVGFENNTPNTSGTINLTANEVNISIGTKNATSEWDAWLALQEAKRLKIKTEIDDSESPFSSAGEEGRNQLTIHRTLRNQNYDPGDLDLLLNGSNRSNIKGYVNDLDNLTSAGEKISKVDFSNLEYLKHLIEQQGSGGDNSAIYEQIVKILSMSETIESDNLTELSNLAQSFSGLEVGELPEIATALEDIATQAQLLQGIVWDKIVEGITNVTNAQTGQSPDNNNSGSGTGNDSSSGTNLLGTSSLVTAVEELSGVVEAFNGAAESVNNVATAMSEIKTDPIDNISKIISTINEIPAKNAKEYINDINSGNAYLAKTYINGIEPGNAQSAQEAINGINGSINLAVKINVATAGATGNVEAATVSKGTVSHTSTSATWNIAKATGTLMGELGPELVVSHGRYFVVGQNGPEMVDLADDAIVFNHLQTNSLLKKGHINTTGKPITNERKAVSFATGNVDGPAMANPSAALSTLKQLRSMWQSLLDASLKDMGAMGGGAGGGGGGGGGNTAKAVAGIPANVELWYNWLKKIETTQNNINKLTKKYTLLEKQGISSNKRLENLQSQYTNLQENVETRQALIDEQKKYRKKVVKAANKGFMSAFYTADENTGQVNIANDDAFAKYIKSKRSSKANKTLLKKLQKSGKIAAGTEIKYEAAITQEKADKKAEKEYKKWLKTDEGKAADEKKQNEKREAIQKAQNEKVGSKETRTLKFGSTIKTGLDFMAELQRTKNGKLVHDAQEQYAMIKAMGLNTEDLMEGVDKTQEGWESQVVQNFYDAVEMDKEKIESLTDSINEQTEAVLDDKIAQQEINEQIREIYQTVPGVNEGLDKWYNYTRRIADEQNRLNKLTKEYSLLQNDQIGNGEEIYKNLKEQLNSYKEQQKLGQDYLTARKEEAQTLISESGALANFYTQTESGSYLFNESALKGVKKTIDYQTSQEVKRNSEGYEIDEKGQYVDENGVLRNKKGKEVKNGKYGQTQVTKSETKQFDASGSIVDVINRLTEQTATGEMVHDAAEQYQIIKELGLEDFIKFDESGSQIYSNFGEMSDEDKQKAVEIGIKRIQDKITELNDNNDEIVKLEEEDLDIQNEILSIENTLRDNAIDVKNQLRDAIVQERQNSIDERNEIKEAIKDAADKTVDGLKESLEKERQTYDSDQNEKELTLLQMQLAAAQTTSGATEKVRDLQQQIQEKQKDIYFDQRELGIEEIEDAANRQVEALETQIDLMQTALEYQVENGLIWKEVNKKLSEESISSVVSYILNNNPDFIKANSEEQQKMTTQTADEVGLYKTNVDDQIVTEEQEHKEEKIKNIVNNVVSKEQKGKYQGLFTSNYLENLKSLAESTYQNATGTEEEKIAFTTKTLKDRMNTDTQHFMAEGRRLSADFALRYYNFNSSDRSKIQEAFLNQYYKTGNIGDARSVADIVATNLRKSTTTNSETTTTTSIIPKSSDNGLSNFIKRYSQLDPSSIDKIKTKYLDMYALTGSAREAESRTRSYAEQLLYDFRMKNRNQKFAKGGEIDFTGLAWVDGSKKKPEYILNAEQVDTLKQGLFNNVNLMGSLVNSLKTTLGDSVSNTYSTINNAEDSITIENVEINMNIDEVANDYDSRRIGQQAFNEMVKIARKAGNRLISRR